MWDIRFSIAADLYNQTLEKLSSQECRMSTLQSTIFNLNMAVYLTQTVCDMGKGK